MFLCDNLKMQFVYCKMLDIERERCKSFSFVYWLFPPTSLARSTFPTKLGYIRESGRERERAREREEEQRRKSSLLSRHFEIFFLEGKEEMRARHWDRCQMFSFCFPSTKFRLLLLFAAPFHSQLNHTQRRRKHKKKKR